MASTSAPLNGKGTRFLSGVTSTPAEVPSGMSAAAAKS